MSKNNNYYFQAFVELIKFSKEAAKFLHKIASFYDHDKIDSYVVEMHNIEHTADKKTHELMEKLYKEFIPPIEREDIITLVSKIDNITDSIEDVLLQLYMYNVTTIKENVISFCELIIKSIEELEKVFADFHNFKKSQITREGIVIVNDIEEKGDNLFTATVRKLFKEHPNSNQTLIYNEIYRQLESCLDASEDVANTLEAIILKNS